MDNDFTFRHADRHLDLMREQIWEARDDIGVYSTLTRFEFAQFQDHIGRPKVVLEVGCGLGRGSIYLNHLLSDPTVHFILADRDGRTHNSGTFAPKNDEFYNDLALTADFCRENGLTNIQTFDTEADDWAELPKADLVLSLCSFGMHVPIERYIDRLIAASTQGATMIFGTRHDSYGAWSFADRFEEVVFLTGFRSMDRWPGEDWLILKRPMGG